MPERLYFRQLLSGRDFAAQDAVAGQMVNFSYAIGDRVTGEAVLVDPAYAVAELVDLVEADGFRLVGALGTHHHADHVGGGFMGYEVQGISELLALRSVPVHVHRAEAEFVGKTTGVAPSDLVSHDAGDAIRVGAFDLRVIHTPGHTPGSQCFLVDGRLVAGDTLFLEGCGRTDLPGADSDAMYESLTQRLAKVPDDTVLYPGHLYSPEPSASMGETRRRNYVFRVKSLEQWRMFMAG